MESRVLDVENALKAKDSDHVKAMAEVEENATTEYGKLEQEHHNMINKMKDAEDKARTEVELRAKLEAEVSELREKVDLAREEGKQAGQQELMDQVKTDFQGVFNRGFRDGWKLALKKAKVPCSLRWFLRDETPLPYPEAGLRNSDTEDEDNEDDEDEEGETEEVGVEQGTGSTTTVPEDPSVPVPEDPSALVPEDPSAPAPIDPAPQPEN
jgi:hypothetical protein